MVSVLKRTAQLCAGGVPMTERSILTRKRLRRNDAGMTLIELVFAAGVLAVALSTMVGALLTLTVMGEVAEGRARAATALAGVMEQMRGGGIEMLTQTPAPVTIEGQVMAITMEVTGSDGQPMAVPLSTDINGKLPNLPVPAEVLVTIMWEDTRGRVYSSRSATMIGGV
jgi:type II secretory pathway pseudopilin PulG